MITVKFNERTKKGKQLFEIILDLETQGYLTVVRIPNAQTIKAINEAREGKGISSRNIKDLFELLRRNKPTPEKKKSKEKARILKSIEQGLTEVKEGRGKPFSDLFE